MLEIFFLLVCQNLRKVTSSKLEVTKMAPFHHIALYYYDPRYYCYRSAADLLYSLASSPLPILREKANLDM
jgi:hypothetical protein